MSKYKDFFFTILKVNNEGYLSEQRIIRSIEYQNKAASCFIVHKIDKFLFLDTQNLIS